jgi:hypothetical protein
MGPVPRIQGIGIAGAKEQAADAEYLAFRHLLSPRLPVIAAKLSWEVGWTKQIQGAGRA